MMKKVNVAFEMHCLIMHITKRTDIDRHKNSTYTTVSKESTYKCKKQLGENEWFDEIKGKRKNRKKSRKAFFQVQ